MILGALRNGIEIDPAEPAVTADDRGFNYGDGLFETTLLRDGSIRFLRAHLSRLTLGCERLQIRFSEQELSADIAKLTRVHRDGVLKIVVTRAAGGRGYRPDPAATANRILTVHHLPVADEPGGLTVRWCTTQLSRNPALAGLKHLNRLEHVLAQNEWHEERIEEGLMCDTEGELVSATAGNVFIVRNGTLCTPDLRFSGVLGVMRGEVLRIAGEMGIATSVEPLWPQDLQEATEVFLTNAVRGIRSVAAIDDQRWESRAMAQNLIAALQL